MITRSPTELFASSKRKYELALSRLRRGQVDLTLLSLHGGLEDVFRAYLSLHDNSSAEVDWDGLIETLLKDSQTPLSRYEAERIRRIHQLCTRIAQGDAVTITPDTVNGYLELVALLLNRYGVVVVIDEDISAIKATPPPELEQSSMEVLERFPTLYERFPILEHMNTKTILVVLLLCVIVASTTALIMQHTRFSSSSRMAPVIPGATTIRVTPAGTPSPTKTPVPAGTLTPGVFAFVRDDVSDGIALRTEPSTAHSVPVQVYLAAKTEVLVIDGPVDAEGYTWWLVRAGDQQGWCAGEFLVAD